MTRKIGNRSSLQRRVENVMVNGFNSDAMKGWGNNTLRAGVDGWYQDRSAREAYGVRYI